MPELACDLCDGQGRALSFPQGLLARGIETFASPAGRERSSLGQGEFQKQEPGSEEAAQRMSRRAASQMRSAAPQAIGDDLFEARDDRGSGTALEAGAFELDQRGAMDFDDLVLAVGEGFDRLEIALQ